MKLGSNCYIETEKCPCGTLYYPPQSSRHYTHLCGVCKLRRKLEMQREQQRIAKLKRKINKKPKVRDVILDKLRDGPKSYDELIYPSTTVKVHISYLRSVGYDIRATTLYTLVREPDKRI